MDTKICGKCKIEKPVTNFARKYDKWTSKCKSCHNEYYKNYWKNTEAYEKHKKRIRVKRTTNAVRAEKYGITLEEVERILASNNGMCSICLTNPIEHIDHCHESRKVRGGLCRGCNHGLGNFKDNPQLLNNAMQYLAGVSPHAYNMLKG